MYSFLRRHKWWLILAVLLVLNAIHYWPTKHTTRRQAGGPPPPGGFPQPDAAMEARINSLPDDQKLAVEDWMKQDRDFAASIQNLPEAERREKMQEHFSENPPPPGLPFPGPGGPDDGGAPHIPPPDVRRGMDQGLVNSMNNAGIP
jgi:hypothetical protein